MFSKLGMYGALMISAAFVLSSPVVVHAVGKAKVLRAEEHQSAKPKEETKFEAVLQHVLENDGRGIKLKDEYFASVLNIYYKMSHLQDDFYRANLATIERQKSDPSYEMPIHKIDSYVQLRASWPLTEELEDKIVYIYRRLNEIAYDASAKEQSQAVEMLNDVHEWIAQRDEPDRLLLSSLLNRIEEIKHRYDSVSLPKKGGRSVASVHEFDMSKYDFAGQHDLSDKFKKNDAKIKERGMAAMLRKNAEFDEAVASAIVIVDDRTPASTPLRFQPSVGPEGTFSGFALPRGEFVQTFDDGPNPTITDKLIDIATSYRDSANPKGVPITFFWLAKNAGVFAKQVARAKSLGILMNNHSWTHPIFHQLNPDQLHHEIADAEVALTKDFGVQPVIGTSKIPFFRCPFGDCIYANHNQGVPVARELIAAQKEIHILWNIDSNDWASINRNNPQRTADLTIAQMKAQRRGVILNHDIQPHTPDAFTLVLAWVKSQNDEEHAGIRYVSVKDAVDQANGVKISPPLPTEPKIDTQPKTVVPPAGSATANEAATIPQASAKYCGAVAWAKDNQAFRVLDKNQNPSVIPRLDSGGQPRSGATIIAPADWRMLADLDRAGEKDPTASCACVTGSLAANTQVFLSVSAVSSIDPARCEKSGLAHP